MSRLHSDALSDVALLGLLAAAALVVAVDLQPVRPLVLLVAACLVPGGAILTRLRTGEGMTDLALAIGLSLAVEVAASLLLAWSGWWHPGALGIALGAASAVLLVGDLLRGARR
jgi:CHASE2 domain-containing sensor protein